MGLRDRDGFTSEFSMVSHLMSTKGDSSRWADPSEGQFSLTSGGLGNNRQFTPNSL